MLYILTCGEQPKKNMKTRNRNVLIFKREAFERARPWAFAQFAKWSIWPCRARLPDRPFHGQF